MVDLELVLFVEVQHVDIDVVVLVAFFERNGEWLCNGTLGVGWVGQVKEFKLICAWLTHTRGGVCNLIA